MARPLLSGRIACLPLALLFLALLSWLPSALSINFTTHGPGIVNINGYGALAAGYNLGYEPRNASALTISVGLSISSTTDPTLLAMDQALQFAVELVNFRGGVMVSGQQHYLSVTYAVDGGSSSQAAAIYASMLSWGNVSAYLAPSSDALLQSVSSQLNQSSAFTLAVYDTDPADYATSAPYLFSQLNTATSRWTAALTAINEQAQSYVTGVRGGSGSMNGIKTLCMLSTSDSLTQAAAAGVRQWIAAENARRLHADNITVYVDGVWAANVTGTYEDYVPYLSACPDGVDVMLLQDSNELTLDVALALTASQLRPRAVLGINPSNVNIANAPAAAAGWTLALSTLSIGSASTLGNVGGKFGSLTDARYGIYYWTAGAGTTVVAPDVSYLYYAAIDVLLATFNQSASLAAAELRAGLLSLNGRSSILGPLAFDSSSGVNDAPQMLTAQVLSNGSPSPVTPSSALIYPWVWPHVSAKPDPIRYITYGPGVVSQLGVAYLLEAYNTSYVPRNTSAPTISIGLSLSLGEDSLLTGMDVAIQYIVDLVNFRGGINVTGVLHYLSITYATDGASEELTQYIYQDMYASGEYALYMAPEGDGLLQSLSSFLSSTQSLMFSVYNQDPIDFATANTNLVSLFNTDDAEWTESLDVINAGAQVYAAQTGTGSVNGIKTFCMLSTNDTLVQAAAEGVRQWIAAENARRGNTDNITVYVDGMWAANVTGTYEDYVPYLSSCPDGVDLMLLQDGSTTTMNAQLALKASRLRPRAALGLDPESSLLGSATLEAAGWTWQLPASTTLMSTLPQYGGKWYNLIDVGYSQAVWAAGANVTGFPFVGYAYTGAIDILAAALAQSKSAKPADVRAALQGLNGQTALLSSLGFSNVTGINIAADSTIIQIQSDGTYRYIANQSSYALGYNTSAILYPYNWPWVGLVQPGDELDHSQSSSLVILGVVICVLGAWVAQIIVEQSIFVRRKGGWYQLWLLVVALALGVVSIWCSVLMTASALNVSEANGGGSLSIDYAFDMALVALLPAILLTWCGLMVLMGDVETTTVKGTSRASQAQQILREQKEAKKKKAALSNRAHFFHLVQAISWRALVGGIIISAAIVVTRVLMWFLWVQDASLMSAGWSWAVTTLINVLVVPVAMLMFFHALRWRVAAVFLFAACVIFDYQVQLAGLKFYYEPGHQYLPSSLLTANIDSTIVNTIAGIIAAFICFIFIGLQFSRMQLSRNGLSVLVASLEAVINKQKDQLHIESHYNHQLRAQLTAALRLVEHINIVTPIATEYAFAMASSTQLETFQALYAVPGMGTSRASHAPSMMSLRLSHGSTAGGKVLGPARVSHTSKLNASKQMVVEEMAELGEHSVGTHRGGDGAEPDAHNKLEGTQSGLPLMQLSEENQDSAARVLSSGSHKVAPAPSSVVSTSNSHNNRSDGAEADDTVDDGLLLSQGVSNAVAAAAISPRRKATEAGEAGSSATVSFHVRIPSVATSLTHSINHSPNALNQPASPTSAAAGGKTASIKGSHQQYRINEDELIAAMDAQLAYRDGLALASPKANNGATVASPKGRKLGVGVAAPAEDTSFDLSMPLLGHKGVDNVQPSSATPTLQMLLSHPICVEVLKAQLQAIHSVENLMFYLHAVRYRNVQSGKLRKMLAVAIHAHFIRENAPQQININTRQRDAISATVARKGDDCPADTFKEAEREVLLLMETNVMKTIAGTHTMRLCSWVLTSMPMGAVTMGTVMGNERVGGVERGRGKESSMLLSDVKSSMTARESSKHT